MRHVRGWEVQSGRLSWLLEMPGGHIRFKPGGEFLLSLRTLPPWEPLDFLGFHRVRALCAWLRQRSWCNALRNLRRDGVQCFGAG